MRVGTLIADTYQSALHEVLKAQHPGKSKSITDCETSSRLMSYSLTYDVVVCGQITLLLLVHETGPILLGLKLID